MPKVKKHIVHRYQRAKLGTLMVWRCILGGCLHYVHNDFIIGLESICKCGRKFTITKDKQRRKTPKCDYCQTNTSLQQRGIGIEPPADAIERDARSETPSAAREINIDDLLEGLE